MMLKRVLTAMAGVLFFITAGMGQKGVEDGSRFGKGADSVRAVTNLSLYQQFVKQRAFKDALPSWRVLFNEAPRASQNMYIHGVTMFKILLEETNDANLKKAYIDTIMLIYDRRAHYFGKRGEVMARKAVELYGLAPDRAAEAYQIIADNVKKEGTAVPEFGITLFMQLSVELLAKNQVAADEVVANFSKAVEILETQLKNATEEKDKETIKTALDNVQATFSTSSAANCDALVPVVDRKYKAAPNDIENLKSSLALMQAVKCEDTPLYATLAETLHKLQPSATSAYNLGKYFLARKDFDKAIPYYQQAIDLEESNDEKAKYYSEFAVVSFAAGRPPVETRRIALKAIELNPNDGRSYIIIGRLYASFNKSISDKPFEQNTAYWAAVDKFMQAKRVDSSVAQEADQLIATFSAYFPSQEDAFFNDLREGQEYTVPGWINEVTKVRIRK